MCLFRLLTGLGLSIVLRGGRKLGLFFNWFLCCNSLTGLVVGCLGRCLGVWITSCLLLGIECSGRLFSAVCDLIYVMSFWVGCLFCLPVGCFCVVGCCVQVVCLWWVVCRVCGIGGFLLDFGA